MQPTTRSTARTTRASTRASAREASAAAAARSSAMAHARSKDAAAAPARGLAPKDVNHPASAAAERPPPAEAKPARAIAARPARTVRAAPSASRAPAPARDAPQPLPGRPPRAHAPAHAPPSGLGSGSAPAPVSNPVAVRGTKRTRSPEKDARGHGPDSAASGAPRKRVRGPGHSSSPLALLPPPEEAQGAQDQARAGGLDFQPREEPEPPKDLGWEDLDEEDALDPLMVSEYVNDIFAYMKKLEVRRV